MEIDNLICVIVISHFIWDYNKFGFLKNSQNNGRLPLFILYTRKGTEVIQTITEASPY